MPVERPSIPSRAKSFTAFAGAGAIVSPIHLKRIALTAAQIIAMGTTPVAILAAPGTGKLLVAHRFLVKVTRTSTAFTSGTVTSFQYHTTTSSVPHTGSIPAAIFTTGGAGVAYHFLGPNVGANGLVIPVNEGIDILSGSTPFASGTGTAEVFIEYSVINAA